MAHLSPLPQRHHYTHLHGLLALLDGLKLSNLLFKRLNLFLAFFFRTWIFHARKATHPPVAVVTIVASARVLARPARALFVVFFGPGVWAVLITVKPNTPKVHIEKMIGIPNQNAKTINGKGNAYSSTSFPQFRHSLSGNPEYTMKDLLVSLSKHCFCPR